MSIYFLIKKSSVVKIAVVVLIMFSGIGGASSQAESQVGVHKINRLYLNNVLSINHDQLYNFDASWMAVVWDVKNLDFITYKISTPLNFTMITNWGSFQNWSGVNSHIPYTHTGNDYVWNLSLADRLGSSIDLHLNETTQANPWVDLTINKTQEGNNTRLNITLTPAVYLSYFHLIITGDHILSYMYPENMFYTVSSQDMIVFRKNNTINMNQANDFSILVNNPGQVKLWLDSTPGWVIDEPSNAIVLPVNGFGSINVSSSVPVKWSHRPTLPSHVQDITVIVNERPVITNARVEPNISVSPNNPAIGSAYVTGSNLKKVSFGVIDSNNLVDTNMTVLGVYVNESGLNGTYVSTPWHADAWSITNGTAQDIVTVILHASLPDYFFVFGSFKKNAAAGEVNAILWFNKTTGDLSNITTMDTLTPLPIENGVSNFKVSKIKFTEGLNNPPRDVDGATFILYGIGSQNNPHRISTPVPAGIYKAFVHAMDANGKENGVLTDIAVSHVVEGIRGDVNRNDRRDTGDATLILRSIVGLPIPSQYLPILPAGDMNCNDRIDTGDATLVLRDVVGLPIPGC